jgi:hypothetical protein
MVAAMSDGAGGLKAPVAGMSSLCTIKTVFLNLIHQADLQVNGKTIESTQSFINVPRHFQLLSEMRVNDLATIGHSLGFSPTLDNTKSMKYNGVYGASTGSSGNGFTNNRAFGTSDNQIAFGSLQNAGVGNADAQYKIGKYYDTSATASANNIVGPGTPAATGTIVTAAQLASEFRPYYEVKNTNYMVWYDFCVIKLPHLFESLGKMGLVRRFDVTLRLWVNTGTVNITVTAPTNATDLNYYIDPDQNSFSNTCPLLINYIPSTSGIPTGTTNITAGLYISKPPSTSYTGGVNLANSSVDHPLVNCLLYFSQMVFDPQKSLSYVDLNRNKKVVYRTFCSNMYLNIQKGSSFNQLINSGIVHPTGVLIVPFVGSVPSQGFGDSQWKSPFDTCPATTSPCSITNLQVSVGGSNVLQSTLFYTYENF